jgi:hypothetical protein
MRGTISPAATLVNANAWLRSRHDLIELAGIRAKSDGREKTNRPRRARRSVRIGQRDRADLVVAA